MAKYRSLLLAAFVAAFGFHSSTLAAAPGIYLLQPTAVFTAEDGRLHPGWVVRVEGQRIAAVGPADKVAAAGAQAVELPGMTAMAPEIRLLPTFVRMGQPLSWPARLNRHLPYQSRHACQHPRRRSHFAHGCSLPEDAPGGRPWPEGRAQCR